MTRAKIFFLSLAILFLEFICIRYISSNVFHISYFSNLILMAAFTGMALGFITKFKKNLINFMPLLLLIILIIIKFLHAEINVSSKDVVYYDHSSVSAKMYDRNILIPFIFLMVTMLFISISQSLGKLFKTSKPLSAYKYNILGSIAGTLLFFMFSYFSIQPVIWFLTFFAAAVLILPRKNRILFIINLLLLVLSMSVIIKDSAKGDYVVNKWSPYYKITVVKYADDKYSLKANGIGHLSLIKPEILNGYKDINELDHPHYQIPYDTFKDEKFKDVLIIGAGGGNDVSYALLNNAEHIDAVEIDPVIIETGKKNHPFKPYSDKRVKIYNNDARNFLERTNKKYDLIIFALTDSLILASNQANLRLESYLYTIESFTQAKNHLKPDGLVVLYNFYRQLRLIGRLCTMLKQVFGYEPVSISNKFSSTKMTMLSGPKIKKLTPEYYNRTKQILSEFPDIKPATDDWPFVYLKDRSLPRFYLKFLFIIVVMILILTALFSGIKQVIHIDLPFFFLGLAFMLIETKSIINFNLIFGSTWNVNSLVITAVLLTILAAIYLNEKLKITSVYPFFFLLFISLLLNYLLPVKIFLGKPFFVKYILSSLLFFSPIAFANIIFATLFKNTKQSDFSFGSNLLGSSIGGFCEYFSMVTGFHNLIIIVALFYFTAFILTKLKRI